MKNNQVFILRMENEISEVKSMDGCNRTMDMAEENIHTEEQRK